MNKLVSLPFLLLSSFCVLSFGQKLPISIYYESLCPDSSRFITNQLYPAYEYLKDYIALTFVPFGKAESAEGKTFVCQHGQAECSLNMIQSCGLYIRAGNSDEQVEYVNCEMKMPFTNDTNSKICQNKSEDWKIAGCYNGGLGYQLQIEAERITHKIAKPYPSFVPTIVYNSIFDKDLQDRSLTEFANVICEQINNVAPYCSVS
ncbi:GILT-like protein 1 [Pseudolycoriella hygida]|uniref:GILT-like protein 1 n=1 Tax=Pseudolycoriella hygida TaxID=35572 RepID=A0A9Q0RWR9_9DIPT|nr:GILT-like protein 1 [Pseudolycoriella hygida]